MPPLHPHTLRLATIALVTHSLLATTPVPIGGDHENPNQSFGHGSHYKLNANTKFGWKTQEISGDIHLNGHSLTFDTGGGNRTTLQGSLSGHGNVLWLGGGIPQVAPSTLTGPNPNTFTGTFSLGRGILDLNKPQPPGSIPKDLVIGTVGPAIVRLLKPEQIHDHATVSFSGPGPAELHLQGHSETIGNIILNSNAIIDMGDGPNSLSIHNPSHLPWDPTKTLTILNFNPSKNRLLFPTNPRLPESQLATIGFENPTGLPNGIYTAQQSPDGALLPLSRVEPQNPPFDLSPTAQDRRTKSYDINGLQILTSNSSTLPNDLVIDFFGDSITWQNGFIETIKKALQNSPHTRTKNIQLINRGINGGGVLSLRDGSDRAAYPGNQPQKPFADVIAADHANIAVIFIGINDVWWRKTDPSTFKNALRQLVESAHTNKTRPILATLTVRGELPDGTNSDDPAIEHFANITREVAQATKTTLVDLRNAYSAYLKNHNAKLRVNGTLHSVNAGILTYDGVHPNATGVQLLANLLAEGIARSTSLPPTP